MAGGDDIIILDGCTIWYSDANGDLEAREHEGFFYEDVRHISRWQLRIDGKPLDPLSSRRVDYYSARIVCTTSEEASDNPPVSVRRDRFVSEGAHEDVVLENLSDEPHDVTLELTYGSDFADVMEAQEDGNGEGRSWQDVATRSVTLWHDRDGYRRGTVLTFNRQGQVQKTSATFRVRLRPRETWKLCVDMTPIVDGERKPPMLRCDSFHDHAPKMPQSLDEWLDARRATELFARDVAALFAKITRAVDQVHLHGVVHRDLKPSNVRIDRRGEPKILDFGLARLTQADEAHT